MKDAKEQEVKSTGVKGYIEKKEKELAEIKTQIEQMRANVNATAGAIQAMEKTIKELKEIKEQ